MWGPGRPEVVPTEGGRWFCWHRAAAELGCISTREVTPGGRGSPSGGWGEQESGSRSGGRQQPDAERGCPRPRTCSVMRPQRWRRSRWSHPSPFPGRTRRTSNRRSGRHRGGPRRAPEARGAEIGEEAAGDTDAVGCSSSRPVFPSGAPGSHGASLIVAAFRLRSSSSVAGRTAGPRGPEILRR